MSKAICPKCQKNTLEIGGGYTRCSCGYEAEPSKAARDYAEQVLGISLHEVAKEGEDVPVLECDCPVCSAYATIVYDREKNLLTCFNCGTVTNEWSIGEVRKSLYK